MKINKILEKVSKEIAPSTREKLILDKNLLEFEKKLRPKLRKKSLSLFIGGSLAKQTLVKRDSSYDIDVFILFPYKYKTRTHELSSVLNQILKASKLRCVKLKGSRDYFQCRFKNLTLELIPILKIKKASEAVNITDISPLHVSYILKQIRKKKKLANEIRLAKAFCYSSDSYGAESYIRGFSGYALEVLICFYKSFSNFIRTASKWKLPTTLENKIVIDPKKHYKNKTQVLRELNRSKLASPLILIDPVQRERNVTAALNYETFRRFIKTCKAFLSRPSKQFFFKKDINIEVLKREAKRSKSSLVIIEALSSKRKADIAGAKLKKLYEFLFFSLKKNGFKVVKGTYDFNEKTLEARFFLIVKKPSKFFIVSGPPLNVDKKYVRAFKKKWPRTFVKKGRLFAKAKRKVSNVKELTKTIPKAQLKEMGIREIRS